MEAVMVGGVGWELGREGLGRWGMVEGNEYGCGYPG